MGACFTFVARQVLVQTPSSSKARSKGVMNKTMINVPGPLVVLVLLLTKEKNYAGSRRQFFVFVVVGVDTPEGPPTPPNPPSCTPTRQKEYQSAPFFIRYPSAYSSRSEIEVLQNYGAKTEIRTPMHAWPTRHPQLASTAPHCFYLFRIPLTVSCWHNPGNLEWMLLHWLDSPHGLHSSACAFDFWTCPQICQDPPFNLICSKRVATDWLELKIPMIY